VVESHVVFQWVIPAPVFVRGFLWKTQNGATITSMSSRLCFVLLILPVMSWGGCGGSSPECIVGASAACACLGQQTGVQVCTSSGSYGTCVCGATPAADASASDTVASRLDAVAAGGSVGSGGTITSTGGTGGTGVENPSDGGGQDAPLGRDVGGGRDAGDRDIRIGSSGGATGAGGSSSSGGSSLDASSAGTGGGGGSGQVDLANGESDGGISDAPMVSPGTGGNGGAGGYAEAGGANCGTQTIGVSRQPADVLLVLDRSGSMAYSTSADANCATGATDCTGRWPALTSAVSATLSSASGSISWGLKLFSSTGNACGVNSGVEVAIAPTSVSVIQSVIANTQPGGNTPTAQAIQAATAYLQTVNDQNTKSILLATDGEPNCGSGSNSAPNVQAAVEVIAAAKASGFLVYVIGIGPSVGNLDNFAAAGGTTNYFPAISPQAMSDAFTAISNSITTCTFNLTQTPPDVNNVAVYLDKSLVAKDRVNGWSLGANALTIVLNGTTCDKMTSGAATQVQVLFGCPGISPPSIIP
jgi:hypothetical protein